MHGVRFTEIVSGMVSWIRFLVGVLMGILGLGGPHNSFPIVGHRHPPAELADDIIAEILFRLPPDQPSHLFTASLVSKTWHRIIYDPVFTRRYREFHGAPPLLGFFFRNFSNDYYKLDPISRFIPTTKPPLMMMSAPRDWMFLDSRHGRVLVESSGRLIVWDPITTRQEHLPLPSQQPCYCEPITAAVLCAVAECNHLDCHGGPFLVVSIGNNYENNFIWARVYSSEDGAWGTGMVAVVANFSFADTRPSLLVRDALYFSIDNGLRILKYDLLGEQGLTIIDAPEDGGARGIVVIVKVGDELGFACVEDCDLHLWSRQVGVGSDTAEWVQHRVIKLMDLLRIPVQVFTLDLIGFVEEAETIFINTDGGIYILDIKSLGVRKVGMTGAYHFVVPFTSFYTPDLAALRFQVES